MITRNNLSSKVMFLVLFISIFAITNLFYGIGTCQAESSPADTPVLVVSATGTVTTAPDQARISLAVTNSNKQLDKAQAENNIATQNVISSLQKTGISDKCIETTNYRVYPQYNYSAKDNTEPQITGYRITNEISVTVKDIDSLGHLLDTAIKAGANNINYINFEKSDITTIEDEALSKAFLRARGKAVAIANAAGMQLGKVISIKEAGAQYINPRNTLYLENSAADMKAGQVPVVPGNLKVNATVTVTYELI